MIGLAGKIDGALKWLQTHGNELAKKYKDQWLAISSKGVQANGRSYSKIADEAAGKNCLLIKIPKYPQAAYVY